MNPIVNWSRLLRISVAILLAAGAMRDNETMLADELSPRERDLQREIEDEVPRCRLPQPREVAKLLEKVPKRATLGNPKFVIPAGGYVGHDRWGRIDVVNLNSCRVEVDLLRKLQQLRGLKLLQLADSSISDRELTEVSKIKSLESLDLSFTNVGDTGLKVVGQITNLLSLDLCWCQITDRGLRHLAGLEALTSLALSSCIEVSDEGVENVAGLAKLKWIFLDETSITDRSMRSLRHHSKLERLWVNSTAVGDAGLKFVSELSQLEELNLYDCRGVTDRGVSAISLLSRLKRLELSGTSITDECVRELSKMKRLRDLFVGATRITKAGRAELTRALPGVGIVPME